jgi:arabinofuranosyltransferase
MRALYLASLAVVFGVLQFLYGYNEFWDDSFIGMLYARNLARGIGPYFLPLSHGTVTAYAQVEGYSNPLWTLILAGLYWMPGSVFLWIKLISALSAVLLAWFCARLLGDLAGGGKRLPLWVSGAAGLLTLLVPSVFAYVKTGMETVTFTALVIGAMCHTLVVSRKSSRVAFVLNALLWLAVSITRPEGVLYGLAAGLFLFGSRWRQGLRRMLGAWAAPFLIMLCGFLALRYGLYQEWLPNTFYAKVALRSQGQLGGWVGIFGSGGVYAARFFVDGFPLLLLVFALAGVLLWFKVLSRNTLILMALMISSNLAFVVLVGGDFWPLYRLLQITSCLLTVLAIVPIAMVATRRPFPNLGPNWSIQLGPGWSAVLVLALFVSQPVVALLKGPDFYGDLPILSRQRLRETLSARHVTPWFLAGKWLKENLPPDAVIGVDQAGQIPYYSDREVVDLLGLNDRYLARHALSTHYLRQRGVSHLIAAVVEQGGRPTILYPGLLSEPEFKSDFCLTRLFDGVDQHGRHQRLVLFTRRDLLGDPDLPGCGSPIGPGDVSLEQLLARGAPMTRLTPEAVRDLTP